MSCPHDHRYYYTLLNLIKYYTNQDPNEIKNTNKSRRKDQKFTLHLTTYTNDIDLYPRPTN